MSWNLIKNSNHIAEPLIDKPTYTAIKEIVIPISRLTFIVAINSAISKPNWELGAYALLRLNIPSLPGEEECDTRKKCWLHKNTHLDFTSNISNTFKVYIKYLVLEIPYWIKEVNLKVWENTDTEENSLTTKNTNVSNQIDTLLSSGLDNVNNSGAFIGTGIF